MISILAIFWYLHYMQKLLKINIKLKCNNKLLSVQFYAKIQRF